MRFITVLSVCTAWVVTGTAAEPPARPDQTIAVEPKKVDSLKRTNHAEVRSLAFSPDGKVLVSGSEWEKVRRSWGLRWDGTVGRIDVIDDSRRQVQVWELPANKQRHKLLLPDSPPHYCPVAVTPDGTGVVAEADPRVVAVYDLTTGKVRHSATLNDLVQAVAVRPDGGQIAAVDPYGRISLWEPGKDRTSRLEARITTPMGAAFSPDGKQFALSDYRTGAVLIDVATGKAVREFRTEGGEGSLAFSPDGKTLAVARYDEVRLWDTATGKLVHTLDGRAGRVHTVAFGPDGKWVASGHPSRVILWDAASGKVLGSKDIPERDVSAKCLAVSPDGKVVAVGDEAGTIRLWATAELSGAKKRE